MGVKWILIFDAYCRENVHKFKDIHSRHVPWNCVTKIDTFLSFYQIYIYIYIYVHVCVFEPFITIFTSCKNNRHQKLLFRLFSLKYYIRSCKYSWNFYFILGLEIEWYYILSHNLWCSSNITKINNISNNISRGYVFLIKRYNTWDKFQLTSFIVTFHNWPSVNLLSSLGYTYHFSLATLVYLFGNKFWNKISKNNSRNHLSLHMLSP